VTSAVLCRVYARKDAHRRAARIYARAATVFTKLLKIPTHFAKLLELLFSPFARKLRIANLFGKLLEFL
jgi:hypothetical protein